MSERATPPVLGGTPSISDSTPPSEWVSEAKSDSDANSKVETSDSVAGGVSRDKGAE